MREHGLLRRALLVYGEAARLLRRGSGLQSAALSRTASLFRSFGEDYHERALEEEDVFPAVARMRGPAATLADILKAQHDRGRAVTDYILEVTRAGSVASGNAAPLADALDNFVLMYQHHTAMEDTVLFPAWKEAVTRKEYRELSERFEQLEHQMFGKDGFEDAIKQIADIERAFGLDDLARFTVPAPRKPSS